MEAGEGPPRWGGALGVGVGVGERLGLAESYGRLWGCARSSSSEEGAMGEVVLLPRGCAVLSL